jgi:beta-lactam-binding protein with PASTA domain
VRTAVAGAAGFLAGVLLVAILGGAKPVVREATVTVSKPVTTGGTVITKTIVPDVVGERLDVALDRISRAGFDADVDGGGVLGILVEDNWEVVAQDPPPGRFLEQGSSVRVAVERR